MANTAPSRGPQQIRRAVAVGATDHRSVRIWCRAGRPGRYRLAIRHQQRVVGGGVFEIPEDSRSDYTCSVRYPDDLRRRGANASGDAPDLAPLTLYTFRVTAAETEGDVVGAGRFETYPARPQDTPARFSVGVMSCHQPFDHNGRLSAARMRLLSALPGALDSRVKFLIAAGDQMYADGPGGESIFEPPDSDAGLIDIEHLLRCDWDTIRAAYQDRYRAFWQPIPWRKLLSSYPIYPMLDDHEIVDAAGSRPEHQQPAWQKLFGAARAAFMDYQGALLRPWPAPELPPHFGHHFDYGHTGVFVFDARSERRAGLTSRDSQAISETQHRAFGDFLRARRDARVLLIVTSVPLIHLPEWLTNLGDTITGPRVAFLDHWSLDRFQPDRDRILDAVRAQLAATGGRQKIVFVGGDVHVGTGFVLTWRDQHKHQFYQFTSSPLTQALRNWETEPSRWGPELLEQTGRTYDDTLGVRLLRPSVATPGAPNPIDEQNFGLIDIETRGQNTHLRFRFLGYDPARGQTKELFSTGLL
ncbi:MAG: hypothetical protein Tsb0020_53240 [Haliangiales bacterium]